MARAGKVKAEAMAKVGLQRDGNAKYPDRVPSTRMASASGGFKRQGDNAVMGIPKPPKAAGK